MKNIKNNINIYKANQKIKKTKKQYGGSNGPDTILPLSIDDDMLLTLTGFNKQMFLNLLQDTKPLPNFNRIIIDITETVGENPYYKIMVISIIESILKQNGMEKRDNLINGGLPYNNYMLNDNELSLPI